MTILFEIEIPRTLDALVERFSTEPATRVEVWLFEDRPAREAAERALAAHGVAARLRSAYKPLLHFWLDDAPNAYPRAVIIHAPDPVGRFRLETYPLADLIDGAALTFEPSAFPLEYEIEVAAADGARSTHRVFAPNRAVTDHLGRETLAPCGWLRVWHGDALVEDARIETEFEAVFASAMQAVAAHPWGEETPYFETLTVTVETGGIERPVGTLEECVSTREALHEDLYFSLLEFFQRRAGRPAGDRLAQPGQIVPDIRPGAGPTRVRVEVGPHRMLPLAAATSEPLDAVSRPLTFDEIAAELATLGGERFDGRSVQGRPVFATVVGEERGPGIVISAAQHGNETSGIVGGLRAARVLSARGESFALIPVANPDGHALHHRLREIHPRHMHHAARYTALGDDLEMRTAEPLYEKATRLEAYRRVRAGLHLNLHGYPSHEWTRPLTGYAPRGFEDWAVPRGFFLIVRHAPGLAEAADAFLRALTGRVAEVPGLRAFNERHLATHAAYAENQPERILNAIPCLVSERAAPDVPFTLVSEYPDETIYGDAFRLAHSVQMQTVLAAVNLYRTPGGLASSIAALGA